jgi:hypothetical protein
MAVLERALENAKLVPIDRVIDELGQDFRSKKSAKRWPVRSSSTSVTRMPPRMTRWNSLVSKYKRCRSMR